VTVGLVSTGGDSGGSGAGAAGWAGWLPIVVAPAVGAMAAVRSQMNTSRGRWREGLVVVLPVVAVLLLLGIQGIGTFAGELSSGVAAVMLLVPVGAALAAGTCTWFVMDRRWSPEPVAVAEPTYTTPLE